ncbi:MAG: alpha-ketoacid dehydrogenase subunit beta [Solirubrobacteraceae bacterium]
MSGREHLIQAARSAVVEVMAEEESVVVIGEDVRAGGPFSLTKGLADRYGDARVRDTPICELAFTGAAIGMALGGARPFVDLMFNDFITVASDQLFNNAAKLHFMSGGRYSVPLAVWTIAGAGTRWGAHHSQHLEGWLTQVPGLKVLAPSSPAMAHASVRAALLDPDPVVVVADRALLYSREPLTGDEGSPWHPRVVREGSDVTVVTTGRLTHLALQVAEAAEPSMEIIDMQRLAPLDIGAVIESLQTTSRLVVAHDEASCGGLAASLVKAIYQEAFWMLDGPVVTLTSPATPVPAAATLEDAYMLTADDLRRAVDAAAGLGAAA